MTPAAPLSLSHTLKQHPSPPHPLHTHLETNTHTHTHTHTHTWPVVSIKNSVELVVKSRMWRNGGLKPGGGGEAKEER